MNSQIEEKCPAACAAAALLDQTARLIEAIDDRTYTHTSEAMMRGTIGRHVRHSVDHFAAALCAVSESDAEIDYDHRDRDVPMETSRQAALDAIRAVQRQLARLNAATTQRDVTIRVMLTADGTERRLRSTLGRELAFAAHHAIHHNAMIKVIAGELGVATPSDFGMAPSTLDYERRLVGSR